MKRFHTQAELFEHYFPRASEEERIANMQPGDYGQYIVGQAIRKFVKALHKALKEV